jgi:hypothetical protein
VRLRRHPENRAGGSAGAPAGHAFAKEIKVLCFFLSRKKILLF